MKLSDLKEDSVIDFEQWREIFDEIFKTHEVCQCPDFDKGICKVSIRRIAKLNYPINFFNPEYRVYPKIQEPSISFSYKL